MSTVGYLDRTNSLMPTVNLVLFSLLLAVQANLILLCVERIQR